MTLELATQRCTATAKTTGEQCGQSAIPGGTVCQYHGGAAPQVRELALKRLSFARDLALDRLNEALSPDAAIPVDPGTLLAIVDKLTGKIELLEGRATDRKESAHIQADISRGAIMGALDQIKSRAVPIDVEGAEVEPGP